MFNKYRALVKGYKVSGDANAAIGLKSLDEHKIIVGKFSTEKETLQTWSQVGDSIEKAMSLYDRKELSYHGR